MKRTMTGGALALGAALLLSGCAGNQLGEIIGAATGQPAADAAGSAQAEIQGVNTQQRTIQVVTQSGQSGSVRYDDRTVVVYRNEQYPVTALERGDIVLLTLQDVQGTTYVSRIDVQQSVQDRTGSSSSGPSNVMQYTGRVSQVNQTNGTFIMQTTNGNITVSLPYNPPQATLDYFRRLRNGDTVRLEAIPLANARVEIYRFL